MSVEEALSIIKNEVKEVSRDGKRTLKLKCSNSGYANKMISVYGAIYGLPNVNSAEIEFLRTDKYAYPRFQDTEMRENAYQLTKDLMEGKQVTINTGTVTSGGFGASTGTQTTTSAADEDPEKKTDWTTYIIIGAAAAVIILLLWDTKKK